MFKQVTIAGAVYGLALTAAIAAPPAASAAEIPAKARPTSFALSGGGYASLVTGGDVPAGSDRSAFAALGCTNKAGLVRTNKIAQVDLGGLDLTAARTRAWTTKTGQTVSSWARHSIAKVSVLDTPLGSLYLRGVTSTSRAWHSGSGFHAKVTTDVASIVLDPAQGPNLTFKVPAPGRSVTVPGVATIALGAGTVRHNASAASAVADAVRLHVIPTNTRVLLAHTRATISDGIKSALFSGSAYGANATAVEGVVSTGRAPAVVMPCQGTGGKVRSNGTAHLHLTKGVNAAVLEASQRANATNRSAVINERAEVARVALGEGLVIRSVVANAKVTKQGNVYRTSARGTSPGIITLNGERQTIPRTGVLRIAGLAKIESTIVDRSRNSIAVTALRVTLLDGRLATVNLGFARAVIRPSGN